LQAPEMAHVYAFVSIGAIAGLYRGRVLPEARIVQGSTVNNQLAYSRSALRIR
jgi:hypothetical protein